MKPRPTSLADVDALFELRCGVVDNKMTMEQLAKIGVTPASVRAMLASGGYAAPILEEDGRIVAFGMAELATGYVFALFVRRGFEGRGYGKAVLESIEGSLRAHATRRGWLATSSDPNIRAHRFYQDAGWTLVGPTEHGQVIYEKLFSLEGVHAPRSGGNGEGRDDGTRTGPIRVF
jgi:GNAT superfamily N-acetyltransferase